MVARLTYSGTTMAWSKESAESRGYGHHWRKIRERIKKRDNGLCQECLRNGRVTIGNECDHIIPKANCGTDDDSNLEMLCKTHHDEKTVRDKGYKVKQQIGLDGWPI